MWNSVNTVFRVWSTCTAKRHFKRPLPFILRDPGHGSAWFEDIHPHEHAPTYTTWAFVFQVNFTTLQLTPHLFHCKHSSSLTTVFCFPSTLSTTSGLRRLRLPIRAPQGGERFPPQSAARTRDREHVAHTPARRARCAAGRVQWPAPCA